VSTNYPRDLALCVALVRRVVMVLLRDVSMEPVIDLPMAVVNVFVLLGSDESVINHDPRHCFRVLVECVASAISIDDGQRQFPYALILIEELPAGTKLSSSVRIARGYRKG
jgi:hypothetical protein